MSDTRNLGYMIPNQGNGWETKYSVVLADRADIKVIEYQSNGRVAPIIHYYGSGAINAALLAKYNGFPIGTLFIGVGVEGLYVKKEATVWSKFTPYTQEFGTFTLTTPTINTTTNTITKSGIGATRTVAVTAVNGTTSVVLTGAKTSGQADDIAGTNGDLVAIGGTATAPTYTVNTTAIAVEGGSYDFTITLSESGTTSMVYTVTVTIQDVTAVFSAFTTTPGTIGTTGTGVARATLVNVVNTTASVALGITKTLAQTITIGGTDADLVELTDELTTTPEIAVDTDAIKSTGGDVVFTITVAEAGLASLVYTVTVTVAVP